MTLDALGLKYGTGKASSIHNYLRHYERHLAPRRFEALTLLEIGVAQGYSLAMWREYFPHATIVGIDLSLPPPVVAGCHVRIGNQADPAFLQQLAAEFGPFDLVVDDGSHRGDDIQRSLDTLWPALRSPALYCIEDLQTSYCPSFGEFSFLEASVGLLHDVNFRGKLPNADPNTCGDPAIRDRLVGRERDLAALHVYPYLMILEKDEAKLA